MGFFFWGGGGCGVLLFFGGHIIHVTFKKQTELATKRKKSRFI